MKHILYPRLFICQSYDFQKFLNWESGNAPEFLCFAYISKFVRLVCGTQRLKLWKLISECVTVLHWMHSGGIRNHDSHWINCDREEVVTLENSAACVSLEYAVLGLYRIYHIYACGIICITHLCVLIVLTQGLPLLQSFASESSFIPFLS